MPDNKSMKQNFGRLTAALSYMTALGLVALIAVPDVAQAQLTKQEQKCIGALTKDGGKLSKSESKLQQKCLKDAANGKLTGTADACVDDDERGKIAKSAGKTLADETKHCFDGTGFVTATGAISASPLMTILPARS